MITQQTDGQVGAMLRQWRKLRRMSQMDLALSANVSTRHLSFVETGRASPSQDLLLRLSDILKLPLKHTNLLFIAAGYAPRYTDLSLDDPRLNDVRLALDHMLEQHAPYPAVVVNRSYDMLKHNTGFDLLLDWLSEGHESLRQYTNLYRLIFAEDGLRHYCADWYALYPLLLKRLHEECIAYQSEALNLLYEACLACVPSSAQPITLDHHLPVITFTLCKGSVTLEFFSAITTFGTAIDVTVQALSLESMFPANAETRRFFDTGLLKTAHSR